MKDVKKQLRNNPIHTCKKQLNGQLLIINKIPNTKKWLKTDSALVEIPFFIACYSEYQIKKINPRRSIDIKPFMWYDDVNKKLPNKHFSNFY